MGQRNTTQPEEYTFLFQLEKGNKNHQLRDSIFCASAFVSRGMSYVVLRGHWCDASVLNLHVPIEDISSD